MGLALAMLYLIGSPSTAAACPAAAVLNEFHPPLRGPRSGTRLFAFPSRFAEGSDKGSGPVRLALQIDPVDEEGRLIFFQGESWRNEPHGSYDLLTFRGEAFGRKIDPKHDRLPCRGPVTFEIKIPNQQRYAYLTNCSAKDVAAPVRPVAFDTKQHQLISENYRYLFNPENYMQFRRIEFAGKNGDWDLAAFDSRLLIKANVKNFFNMSFDSSDIESQLEAKRLGPVGNLARLSFYLKVLLFKVKMALSTDVGFYEDAGHIPMMVSLPIDARKYLNPKSGILYSWIPVVGASDQKIKMPQLDLKEIEKGTEHLGKLGLKTCGKLSCDYFYSVKIGGRMLSMNLGLEPKLVALGFYPMFVNDVHAYKEKMGWDLDDENVSSGRRVGLYFEVSGLPEGGHPWDFWLKLGEADRPDRTCPEPIEMRKVPGGVLQ